MPKACTSSTPAGIVVHINSNSTPGSWERRILSPVLGSSIWAGPPKGLSMTKTGIHYVPKTVAEQVESHDCQNHERSAQPQATLKDGDDAPADPDLFDVVIFHTERDVYKALPPHLRPLLADDPHLRCTRLH